MSNETSVRSNLVDCMFWVANEARNISNPVRGSRLHQALERLDQVGASAELDSIPGSEEFRLAIADRDAALRWLSQEAIAHILSGGEIPTTSRLRESLEALKVCIDIEKKVLKG